MSVTFNSMEASQAQPTVADQPAPDDGSPKTSAEARMLVQRSLHFMGGTIVLFLLGFVSFPILARIFTVEQYGLIALVTSAIAIATVFSKFGLQNAVQRFYKENAVHPDPHALRTYYTTVYISSAGVGLVVTLLLVLGVWIAPGRLVDYQLQMLLVYASALVLIRSVASMIANLLQVEGRTTTYNLLQIGTKAATIAVTVLLLLTWRRSAAVFFLGTTFVEASAVFCMFFYLRRWHSFALGDFDWGVFRTTMTFGFPLMGMEICWLVLDSGDRFLVQAFLGAKQLGYYAAAYNISGYIRESLASPLYLALMPIVMELWVLKGREKTQEFLSKTLTFFMLVATGVVCAISINSSAAINIVASPKFHEAHSLIPYIVIGMMICAIAIFLKPALMIYKRPFLLLRVNLYACLVNIGLNVVLLPHIGLKGAAIATLGSYAIMTLLLLRESHKLLPLQMEWMTWTKYILVATAIWMAVSRISVENLFLSLAVRGTLSLGLYFGVLYLIDQHCRSLASSAFRLGSEWLGLRISLKVS